MCILSPDDWQTIRVCCKDEAAFAAVHALLQERLRQEAAHSALVLDSLPVGVALVNADGRIVQVNQAMLSMVGLPHNDVLGHCVSDFVCSADARAALAQLDLTQTAADRHSLEFDLRRDDSAAVPVHAQITTLPDAASRPAAWLASVTDMSAYRQAEKALRLSQTRYRQAVENSPNAIFSINRQGTILSWNHACERIFGYRADEMAGQHYSRLLMNPDDRPAIAAQVGRVFQTRTSLANVDIIFQRRDGSGRLMLSRLYPVLDASGRFVRECVFANSDVTEQKLAEESLRHSERMYQALVANLPRIVTCLFDHNLRLLVVGGQGLADVGLNDSAHDSQTLTDLLPGSTAAYLETRFRAALRGEEQRFETSFQQHLYDVHVLPVLGPSGVVLAGLMVARDVTQERKAETALRGSERKLRSLIDRSNDGIVLVNHQGVIVEWNASQERITGRPAAEAIGRLIWDVYAEMAEQDSAKRNQLADQLRASVLSALDGGQTEWLNQVTEIVISRPDGTPRLVQMVAFTIEPEGSSGAMIGSVNRDITEKRRVEREALVHDVERERLRMLTEFITSASHEFRTLLSVINLKLHLIHRLVSDATIGDHLNGIEVQANNILRLVESLLRMSQLDTAAAHRFFPIRLNDALRGVMAALEPAAEQKGVLLDFSPELTAAAPDIAADPEALHTAFYNIVENAIRYSSAGQTVTVRVQAEPDGLLRVEISDSGMGIEAEHLPHIFDAFYRADKARTTPGLGLGLTVARRAVELHKGEIRVVSAPGAGTTVTVLLPAISAPAAAKA
ncbi:MAG: PAS domain S-box protein [Aggregatilineales bacterium]